MESSVYLREDGRAEKYLNDESIPLESRLQTLGNTAIDNEVEVSNGVAIHEDDMTDESGVQAEVFAASETSKQTTNSQPETNAWDEAYKRYEKFLLYFLDQKDQKVEHYNAGGYVRDQLGFTTQEWNNTCKTLLKKGIVSLHKVSAAAKRSDGISLDVEALMIDIDRPYITTEVAKKLKAAINDKAQRGEIENADLLHDRIDHRKIHVSNRASRPIRHKSKQLTFNFAVGDERIYEEYEAYTFGKVNQKRKLLLTIGHYAGFASSDNRYDQYRYVRKILNKDLPDDAAPVRLVDVKKMIQDVEADGLVLNGSFPVQLTQRGAKILKSKNISVDEHSKVQQKDVSKEYEYEAIPPAQCPLTKEDATKYLATIGPTMIKVLDALEWTNGLLNAPKLHLAVASMHDGLDATGCAKSLLSLERRGLVELHNNRQTLVLTEEGRKQISILKSYPELRRERAEKIFQGTSFDFIDYILDRVPYDEKGSRWFSANLAHISDELGVSEDALVRRVYDLREGKGYLEEDIDEAGGIHRRVTVEGVAYHQRVIEAVRQKEGILSEKEAEEADMLLESCLRFSEALGENDLLTELKQEFNKKHFFEMDAKEFEDARDTLTCIYEQLRRDYIWEKSAA